MTQDTYNQALELQSKIFAYNMILANEGDLFTTNLGPNFEDAVNQDATFFNTLRETLSDDFRAAVTAQRNAAQTDFDNLQDA